MTPEEDMNDYLMRRQHIAIESDMERKIANVGLASYRVRKAVKEGEITQEEGDKIINGINVEASPMVNKEVARLLNPAPGIYKDVAGEVDGTQELASSPKPVVGEVGGAEKPGLKLGMGGIGLLIIFAIGYLLLGRRKK